MCSKQEVSPVKWEFNSGDRVELLDGFDRGVIVRQEEKKLDAYGDPFDCLYVVKLDDGPAVALLQSRVRGEQEVSKVELQGETCPWCDRSDMVSSWGWASSGEFENFHCDRCERGFKVLPDIEDDEEDEPDHDAPDETNARAYVETSARGLVEDLRALTRIVDQDDVTTDEVADALDLNREEVEDLGEDVRWEADDRLVEMPLAVEATTTFEVVLGVGGPDRRLCFECDRIADETEAARRQGGFVYEIRRVYYRYSWDGSAEVELTGEDRETAEAFGRRVVPELGE